MTGTTAAMKSRRKAREAALQALYQCDTLGDWSEECVTLYFTEFQSQIQPELSPVELENVNFAKDIVHGVRTNLSEIDAHITAASTHWSLGRMSRVDRNILRCSVFELLRHQEIPLSVVINEGIEVAKRYACDDSPMFINGVLDQVGRTLREHEQNTNPGKRKIAAIG